VHFVNSCVIALVPLLAYRAAQCTPATITHPRRESWPPLCTGVSCNSCNLPSARALLWLSCAGVNLNRAWAEPSEDDSPEVFHLLRVMQEKGEQLGSLHNVALHVHYAAVCSCGSELQVTATVKCGHQGWCSKCSLLSVSSHEAHAQG
jgi:hypothetical protein